MKDCIQLTMGCGRKFYRRASTIDCILPFYDAWFGIFNKHLAGSEIEVNGDRYFVLESPDQVLELIKSATP